MLANDPMVPGSSSPQARVDSRHYSLKYYLTDCSGFDLFKKTSGSELDERLTFVSKQLPVRPGMRILDIGCGRGELAIWLAKQNCQVVGIDYSSSAIRLANLARSKQPKSVQTSLIFKKMDVNNLSFPTDHFDGVVMTEVLEHIYPHEQEVLMSSLSQIIKSGGFVFFHTSPSRWFNDYAYRYWCYPVSTILIEVWNKLFSKKYANLPHWQNLRTPYHKLMHVNEPDYFSLKKLFFNSGFVGKIKSSNITVAKPIMSWKDKLYNFFVYLIPVSCIYPFNILFGADFYALMQKS